LIGLGIIVGFCAMALCAPLLAPLDPFAQNIDVRLAPPGAGEGGHVFVLGADQLGRDILSRLIYGSRISLLVAFTATVLGAALGTALGLISGLWGGAVDGAIMRLVDVQISFPFIFLAIAAVAVLGPTLVNLILVLAISGWPTFARLVRGEVLALRTRDFVEAARALGCSQARLLIRHLLPGVTSSTIVLATLELSRVIVLEASLGFLGLGVPPPTPTWGGMLADSRAYLAQAWWASTFPGLAISVLIFGINMLGDWLRDVLDPRLRS